MLRAVKSYVCLAKKPWVQRSIGLILPLLSHQVGEDFLQSFEIVGPESMDV